MCILCIGIGVSISLICRLPVAYGVGLLSFVVCLPRTMKEYRDVVVKLFARIERPGDIFRRLGDGLGQGPCEIRAAAFGEDASSHQGSEGAESSKNEPLDPADR